MEKRIKEVRKEGEFSWFYPQIKILGVWISIDIVGTTSLESAENSFKKLKVYKSYHKVRS